MTTQEHRTHLYVGIAGEAPLITNSQEVRPLGHGGLFRQVNGEDDWQSITNGLPEEPQVRALLVHPDNPSVIFAGTQSGVYRSRDRGDSWEAADSPDGDVWSLAIHPNDHSVMFAGYDNCIVARSDDGGSTWKKGNTDGVTFPHITMNPYPICKRVIGLAVDAHNPDDVYGAIEVGGLIASRDGGRNWESITDGHYTRTGPVDLHGVQVNSSSPGLVYIITQLAMFRSRNRGSNWEFVDIEEMFPGGSYCRDLVVAPDDPNTMYLAAGAGGGSAPPGTTEAGVLVRSRDAGETWERVELGEMAPSRMFQIAIDPRAPGNVFCSDRDGLVFRSNDGGETWSKSRVPGEMSRIQHVYPMVCG
ncbi:MAG: hypothetical protein F4X65_06905 [Chloroflexi bacterium]|nr:hypothetical protein [Chloroflexota bacterium]